MSNIFEQNKTFSNATNVKMFQKLETKYPRAFLHYLSIQKLNIPEIELHKVAQL